MPVDLVGAAVGLVQGEAPTVAAEGVGQDDIGAGIDEHLVERLDTVGMLLVPDLRRVAGRQAHVEQIGAGGAVGQQIGALFEHRLKGGHGSSCGLGL